jgi:hypothetical protein
VVQPRAGARDPAALLGALDVLADLVAVKVAERLGAEPARAEVAPSSWYTQDTSPLAKRTYLDLCRSGAVECRRVGKRVLVERSTLDAWIIAHGATSSASTAPAALAPVAATNEELMAKAGFSRVARARVEPTPASGRRRQVARRAVSAR